MAEPAASAVPGGPAAAGGLTDEQIRELLPRLDGLLDRLEQAQGPVAGTAMEAVEALTQVYGTALARVMMAAGRAPDVALALTGDELLHHLLVLHGIHPLAAGERAARALDSVRPYIRSHGGEVELDGIDDGVARVRLSGSCENCASSAATLEQAVTDAVLTAAPELSGVVAVPTGPGAPAGPGASQPSPPLIPVESLLRRPPAVQADGGGTG